MALRARFGTLATALSALFAFSTLLATPARAGGVPEGQAPAAPAAPAYRVVDPSLVYLGNPRLFKKPCGVSADRVYRAIPEYKEILDKNLTDKDVRYHFLMKKASDKFSHAIRDLARDFGYDLVAGTGAIVPDNTDTPAVPDGTDATISRLPS